ncbi:universal stress protein [Streptosporangium sp. NPDC049078]|uniref:universal stress protein n=1 Tax=Streptosporangium sp. NPDC049078 TaxID=3155767 RepID=UPI00344AC3DE
MPFSSFASFDVSAGERPSHQDGWSSARREIVVGFDGSPQSRAAVEWAARECRTRWMELTVCHVWDGPHAEREAAVTGQRRAFAGGILTDGVELAERLLPGRTVRSILARGAAGPELVSLGRTARMLVVGRRGLGGVSGVLLGSVSAHVAAYAPCPVLAVQRPDVTPRPGSGQGPVVVGVDGSACSLAALGFALSHGRAHRLPVHVIHACADTPHRTGRFARSAAGEDVRRWVEEVASALEGDRRGMVVTATVSGEPPLAALLSHGHRASLLVVGSRGLGPLRARLLGSVSRGLLHHASWPVAVVRSHGPHGRGRELSFREL